LRLGLDIEQIGADDAPAEYADRGLRFGELAIDVGSLRKVGAAPSAEERQRELGERREAGHRAGDDRVVLDAMIEIPRDLLGTPMDRPRVAKTKLLDDIVQEVDLLPCSVKQRHPPFGTGDGEGNP